MGELQNQFPSLVEKNDLIFNKDMCAVQSRMQTFTDWSLNHRQRPAQLSVAGFYYIGRSDKVTCYYCGVTIYNWMPEDDPWIEHALHSGECPFLRLHKSKLKTIFTPNVECSYHRSLYLVLLVSFLFFSIHVFLIFK
jgi:Inhibitor of Apoptosis domain